MGFLANYKHRIMARTILFVILGCWKMMQKKFVKPLSRTIQDMTIVANVIKNSQV